MDIFHRYDGAVKSTAYSTVYNATVRPRTGILIASERAEHPEK